MNLKALLLALSLLSLIVLPILPADAGMTVPNPLQYTYLTTGGAETCDPAWAYDTASAEIIFNVYQTLVDFDFVYYDQFVEEISDWWPGKGENYGDVITPLDPACWMFDNATLVDLADPVCTHWTRKCIDWHLKAWTDNGNGILDYCDTVTMAWIYDTWAVTNNTIVDLTNPVCTEWIYDIAGTTGDLTLHIDTWTDNGNGILDYSDYVLTSDNSTKNPSGLNWHIEAASETTLVLGAYEALDFHVDEVIILCNTYYTLRLQPLFLDSTWKFHIRKGIKWQDPDYGVVTPFDVEVSLERGMLMDHSGGPQWMFFEPLTPQFGTRSSGWNRKGTSSYKTYRPDGTRKVARWIDDAIDSDEEFVIFNLDQPYIPFMQILSQSWGSVMCADWLRDVGAWNMSWHCPCNTYQGYKDWTAYNNPLTPGPVGSNSMGSGPYYIDYVDLATGYHRLKSFDNYYFGWDRAHCDTIIHEVDLNWATRKARFLTDDPSTQADQVTVLRGDVNDPELLAAIDACKVRYLPHLATLSADAIFWSYDFDPTSPYMHHFGDGSTTAEETECTLLLSDEHMRYALNYAWNATEFIQDYYQGEAATLHNPIIYGIANANSTKHSTMYYGAGLTYAQLKALVTYHFKMAWGGVDYEGDGVCDVPGYIWQKGFHITVVPFPDAAPRTEPVRMIEDFVENEILWEIPAACIDVEVFPLGWSEGLTAMYSELLGAYVVGWLADFPHPHNWVLPFEHSEGDFSYFQHINYGHQTLTLVNVTEVDIEAPICSQWYLLPSCPEYHLGDWTDNDASGNLTAGDDVELSVKIDGTPTGNYRTYTVDSIEQDPLTFEWTMTATRMEDLNWHLGGNYKPDGSGNYDNYAGTTINVDDITSPYVDDLIATGIGLAGDIAQRCYTELMDIYYSEGASRMTYQPEGRRYERTWIYGWFYNSIYPGLLFYGSPGTMNLFKVDPQLISCDFKPSIAFWFENTPTCWRLHIYIDVCWMHPDPWWGYPENFVLTYSWWDASGGKHTVTIEGWLEADEEIQYEVATIESAWGGAAKAEVAISPWIGHYRTDHDTSNDKLTAQTARKGGDLGGPVGVVPKYWAFDGKVDAYDLALWINAQKWYKPVPVPGSTDPYA